MTEIEYEVRESDLIAFNDNQLQSTNVMKRSITRNQAQIPGAIMCIALFYWFYYQDVISTFYIAAIGIAWGFLSPTYIRWSVLRRIQRKYSDEDRKKILGSYKLREEARGLVEITPSKETTVDWSEVLRVELTKKHAFIFVDINEALILPKKTVQKGDFDKFIDKVYERIEKVN